MSEKKKTGSARPMVVVEQSEGTERKPYRPTQLRDPSTDQHLNFSTVPAIPSDADLKDDTNISSTVAKSKLGENEPEILSENKKKHKKHSERSGSPIETIALDSLEIDKNEMKKQSVSPIPTASNTTLKAKEQSLKEKKELKKESFTPIPSLPNESLTTMKAKEQSLKEKNTENVEDSLDEDKEDLSEDDSPETRRRERRLSRDDSGRREFYRTESHSSVVSRAIRKMFCCGITYRAPSEAEFSDHEFSPQ